MPKPELLAQAQAACDHDEVLTTLWKRDGDYWLVAPKGLGQTVAVRLEYDERHNRLHPTQKDLKKLQPEHLTALNTMVREVFGEHPRANPCKTTKKQPDVSGAVIELTRNETSHLRVVARIGNNQVGELRTKEIGVSRDDVNSVCRKGMREVGATKAHYVSSSIVEAKYRGLGIGTKMYVAAVVAAGKLGYAVLADQCTNLQSINGSTSGDAERVWHSKTLRAVAKVPKDPKALVAYAPVVKAASNPPAKKAPKPKTTAGTKIIGFLRQGKKLGLPVPPAGLMDYAEELVNSGAWKVVVVVDRKGAPAQRITQQFGLLPTLFLDHKGEHQVVYAIVRTRVGKLDDAIGARWRKLGGRSAGVDSSPRKHAVMAWEGSVRGSVVQKAMRTQKGRKATRSNPRSQETDRRQFVAHLEREGWDHASAVAAAKIARRLDLENEDVVDALVQNAGPDGYTLDAMLYVFGARMKQGMRADGIQATDMDAEMALLRTIATIFKPARDELKIRERANKKL